MNKSEQTPKVVVCAGSYADAYHVISLGAILANWTHADLSGVLVEDELLVSCGGTKTSRMLTAIGMPLKTKTKQELKRMFSADAKAFETELKRSALAELRSWTFARSQGEVSEKSLALTIRNSIVLIGHRKLNPFASALILISGHENVSEKTMRLTIDLASKMKATIKPISIVPPNKSASLDPEKLLRICLASHVQMEPVKVAFSREAALDLINRSTSVAVIMDTASEVIKSVADLQQLRRAARCPIVLSNMSKHAMAGEEAEAAQTNG